ncbi:MAG: alpha-amylase family glycosyl hydrolase [Chloroflexi bacterium]|nr:alpha-amylase family glycosyl hydrolase [Chloroflexota bacterium]
MNSVLLPDTLPVDIRGGIHLNLLAPGTVTFVFYAPFKPYVSLVGDFNQWDTRANHMITDGSGLWWTTIAHPGATRYGFYVAIDDQTHVWVGDPYATQVEWTEKAPWGVLATELGNFSWTDQAWQTPALRDLTIYELCVRDFAGRWIANRPHYGNFQDMLNYVDYLAEMGINAIELMPIQAFPGQSSWGYNPVFYFAIANTYGTATDFKRFVDVCHAKGISVILDVAFNHAWSEHPYYLFYPPLYGPKGEWLDDWNPFFHQTPRAVNAWGGVDWDHFAAETTRYFQDIVRYWLQEFHLDGFRFDWVGGVDYDSRNPGQAGFDPYHGISAICWAARQAKPDCILIGEYWPLEGTNPEKTAAKLIADTEMDAAWNGNFHHILEDILNQRWEWEKKDIWRALGGFRDYGYRSATEIINYTCSHDEVRPEHEIKFYSWAHIQHPKNMSREELALASARLGLIALFAAPGVPMIYAGQEFGEDTPRTIDFLPLHWDKLQQAAHAEYHAFVTRLIHARRVHPALRSDQIDFYPDNFSTENIVRFKRWFDPNQPDSPADFAAVALNFSSSRRPIVLDLPWDGKWQELVHSRIHQIWNGQFSTTLAPWSGVLLVPKRN